jgi:hypothetical protein
LALYKNRSLCTKSLFTIFYAGFGCAFALPTPVSVLKIGDKKD